MKYFKDVSNSNGKWSQPCTIVLKLNDIDHADKLADVLNEVLNKAAQGGDLVLNGQHIGHDVNVQSMSLTVGNVVTDLE